MAEQTAPPARLKVRYHAEIKPKLIERFFHQALGLIPQIIIRKIFFFIVFFNNLTREHEISHMRSF